MRVHTYSRQQERMHTSTASRMATTKTSRAEFLHPTTTPLRSDRGRSAGQNTRIKPSCSGMTVGEALPINQKDPLRLSCSLADIPDPFDRGCCSPKFISLRSRPSACGSGRSYHVRLCCRNSFHGDKDDEEDETECNEGFGSTGLYLKIQRSEQHCGTIAGSVLEEPVHLAVGNKHLQQLRNPKQIWQAHRGE